ncbi:HTH-type transcriptional regulator glxA [Candidatus Rhodobacter oscarellae]|uniref:HTH-type transcriptional regulator glxA n=1 Tax=Candidatus Rhodobacter oscarellae TaxID=1675527 RepID=A0A0J9E296_9RHOB|nr:GlxA family transcriptional regulator [Candidatus Rhodobacter lobularis]KMW56812.1 HTH-type transcriptional regulator glxA [Candidatus Rhodobacter lobularis]
MDGTGSNSTRIGVLALPGFALMSYASTVEPFRAANLLSRRRLYEVLQIGGAASSGGMQGAADHAVGDPLDVDVLFVVAGGDPMAVEDPALFAWLRRLARQGVLLGGVSGGPAVLARAGLMQGRRMTVHWEHAAALAEMDPRLLIERSLYVIDRDRVTCAGGTAPLDLMHALIARDHGAVFARLVSDWFLHTDIRPSGGPQRAGLVERVGTTAAPVLDAVEAMENHVADPLVLDDLAALAGVSARQLTRLFRDRLGASPMAYYRDLRLDVAERLLVGSAMPLTEIALAVGFANSSHFSKSYAARNGRPPSRARR